MTHIDGVDDKQRKEITQILGKLKGTWRLSYNHQVNYLIKSPSYFQKADERSIFKILQSDELSLYMKA